MTPLLWVLVGWLALNFILGFRHIYRNMINEEIRNGTRRLKWGTALGFIPVAMLFAIYPSVGFVLYWAWERFDVNGWGGADKFVRVVGGEGRDAKQLRHKQEARIRELESTKRERYITELESELLT